MSQHSPPFHPLCLIFFISVFLFGTLITYGQNNEDLSVIMNVYQEGNGQGYLQPLADAFTTNLHAGLYRSPKIPKGFHLDVGVVTSFSFIGSSQKTFTAVTEPEPPNQTVTVPTIFGDNQPVRIPTEEGTTYTFPGGYDVSILPLAVPQLKIGTLLGTEALVRYIAFDVGDDFEQVQLFGFGLRHSLSQYLEEAPVDLAIGYYQQRLDVAEIIEADTRMFHLHVGRQLNLLSYYAILGYQQGTYDVAYEFSEIEDVQFEMENAGNILFGAGIGLKLPVFYVHAELNYSKQLTAALGIGFNIRSKSYDDNSHE